MSTALEQLMRDYWWILALYVAGGLVLGYAVRDFQQWVTNSRRERRLRGENVEVTRIRGAWTQEPEDARVVVNPQPHATVAISREELNRIRLAILAQRTLGHTTGSIPRVIVEEPSFAYLGAHAGSVGRHRLPEVVDVKPVSVPSWARPAVALPQVATESYRLNPNWREMQPA